MDYYNVKFNALIELGKLYSVVWTNSVQTVSVIYQHNVITIMARACVHIMINDVVITCWYSLM